MFSEKETDKHNSRSLKNIVTVIKRDRNIFIVLAAVLLVIALLQYVSIRGLIEETRKTREVVYITIRPDATYQVSEYLPDEEQPITNNIVNSLMDKYIRARFGLRKATVERDYAEAVQFMSDKLANEFIDQKGFNVHQKIKDVQSGKFTTETAINNIRYDHYDVIDGQFDKQKKPVIRTSVTCDETVTENGRVLETRHKRMSFRWTVLSKEELSRKTQEQLSVNPIGLVVIDQTEDS